MRVASFLLLLTGLGACSTAPMAGATVRALRFRQFLYQGELDQHFGGGQWHDCLYLPDAGVACHVVWENEMLGPEGRQWQPGGDFTFREYARLYAFRSSLEREIWARPKESPEGRRPPEEIRIDAALARAIVSLADLTEQQRATGERLAGKCIAEGVVGDKDSRRQRDF